MDADWIKSPTARRILVHWADPRPAWLWSSDGARLLWRNRAARYFLAKPRRTGLRLAPPAVPIKGQVARLIRLGSTGRPSLSRIRFLAGAKPVSATCTITPLMVADGSAGLLVVGVDPIEADILAQAEGDDRQSESLFPDGGEYLLVKDGHIAGGSAGVVEQLPPAALQKTIPQLTTATETVDLDGWRGTVTRYRAGPDDAMLLLFLSEEEVSDAAGAARPAESVESSDETAPSSPASETFVAERAGSAPTEPRPAAAGAAGEASLAALFDRLANDAELFAPLDPPEVPPSNVPAEPSGTTETASTEQSLPEADAEETLRAIIAFSDDDETHAVEAEKPRAIPTTPEPTATTIERVSRYNFDELSRILSDRVAAEERKAREEEAGRAAPRAPAREAGERPSEPRDTADEEANASEPPVFETPRAPAPPPITASAPIPRGGMLVSLTGETIILNRLPLGILLFRDQQLLFANRAITDLIGYSSVEDLRSAGLSAIFPNAGENEQSSGPVNHLVHRDGSLVPVAARLQSVSWQARPALMLSASSTSEARTGHEGAVRAFAALMADARGEGFVTTERNGVVSEVSAAALSLLGLNGQTMVGRPISALLDPEAVPALQRFLERPARFAETTRPLVSLGGQKPGTELLVFAEGQAGIVTGYFGFVRNRAILAPASTDNEGGDVAILARVSRGLRRPLNAVVGFADLIGSSAFGPIHNPRYIEYARDIQAAGMEIAAIVGELDDFVRLRDGNYRPRRSDVDLIGLLEASVTRIRGQAGRARVLVRSAISERLPKVRVDRAAMGQAVLNLLASAIDQTPVGGSVILSAQPNDDGSVAVHVRDSGPVAPDPAERFVVFRDGVERDGTVLTPVRSTVGLALTRSLLAVNQCELSIDPAGGTGTLFSLQIPAELIAPRDATKPSRV